LEIFLALTGNPHYVATTSAGAFRTVSASLPYNYPLPMVIKFEGKKFCLTGKFDWSFGPRSDIEQAVRDAGGETQKNVTKETDFLVIGDAGNRDWIHSTYGRKVERAVALRDAGQALAIIPEHQIVSRLFK
jgi:NAD-dependent DNA ligase